MKEKQIETNVQIGTPDQVLWTKVSKEAKYLIEQSEQNIKIQTAILKLAEEKISEEKAKS